MRFSRSTVDAALYNSSSRHILRVTAPTNNIATHGKETPAVRRGEDHAYHNREALDNVQFNVYNTSFNNILYGAGEVQHDSRHQTGNHSYGAGNTVYLDSRQQTGSCSSEEAPTSTPPRAIHERECHYSHISSGEAWNELEDTYGTVSIVARQELQNKKLAKVLQTTWYFI